VRYLDYREDSGPLSMGIDEALLILRGENKIEDTFRFYSFNPSCVSIGYFQKIDTAIDLDYCNKNNIDYVSG
jgi:lipoate-protein ligase A